MFQTMGQNSNFGLLKLSSKASELHVYISSGKFIGKSILAVYITTKKLNY